MATESQRRAAQRNIRKASTAAQRDRTIARLPKATRRALGQQGAAVAQRNRTGAETPLTRRELYEEARKRHIAGRASMSRAELARALGER